MKLTSDLIFGFAGSLLSLRYDEPAPTPDCHKEWWDLCCSPHKRVAIAAPRGHAKSTAITKSYTLASVLFRDRQFVLVVSDTYKQAVLFLGEIKRELEGNQDLRDMFGLESFPTDREDDFIVHCKDGHEFRIMALGSEQKVRGLLWDGRRPDLIVGDDLENDEIVMNPDRREKFRNWINNALLPCMSERGIVRFVGTILHMDSMLERFMPKDRHHNTIELPLKSYMKKPVGGWMGVRYRAHDEDDPMKANQILWPGKWSKKRLKDHQEVFVGQGNPEGYFQEYLNRPIDPSNAYFRRDDFLEMSEDDKRANLRNYLTMDLALTTKERRDYCAFVVGGMDSAGMLHVHYVLKERMDSMEIIDTIFRLFDRYHPDMIVMEAGAIEKALGPFLNAEMQKRGIYLPIMTIPSVTDKPQRARSIQARMRAGGVKFDKEKDWYFTLESEMLRFPKDAHDDQVDAMALLGQTLDRMLEASTPQELKEEEYLEDYGNSGLVEEGRNLTTGY